MPLFGKSVSKKNREDKEMDDFKVFLQALRSGDIEGVERYLAKVEMINQLHELALDKAAEVDKKDIQNEPVIFNKARIIKMLIEKMPDKSIENVENVLNSCFGNAVHQGVLPIVMAFADVEKSWEISLSEFINEKDILSIAVNKGHLDVAKYLIEVCGADVDLLKRGRENIFKFLFDGGVDVNLPDKNGDTPLIRAVKNGREDITRLLLENGADVDLTSKSGETSLMVAAENCRDGVVELLIEHGADVNLRGEKDDTPLRAAVRKVTENNRGRAENAAKLISVIYEQNLGNLEVIIPILKEAKLVVPDIWDDFNFVIAGICASKESYAALALDVIFKANAHNKESMALIASKVLINVAAFGNLEIVKLLIERGADVQATNNTGATSLFYATLKGCLDVVRLLIERGANVNLATNSGATPLIVAVQNSHAEIVVTLISAICEKYQGGQEIVPELQKAGLVAPINIDKFRNLITKICALEEPCAVLALDLILRCNGGSQNVVTAFVEAVNGVENLGSEMMKRFVHRIAPIYDGLQSREVEGIAVNKKVLKEFKGALNGIKNGDAIAKVMAENFTVVFGQKFEETLKDHFRKDESFIGLASGLRRLRGDKGVESNLDVESEILKEYLLSNLPPLYFGNHYELMAGVDDQLHLAAGKLSGVFKVCVKSEIMSILDEMVAFKTAKASPLEEFLEEESKEEGSDPLSPSATARLSPLVGEVLAGEGPPPRREPSATPAADGGPLSPSDGGGKPLAGEGKGHGK